MQSMQLLRRQQVRHAAAAAAGQCAAAAEPLCKGGCHHCRVLVTAHCHARLAPCPPLPPQTTHPQDRDTAGRAAGGLKCHFFNTFFMNKLYEDEQKYKYANVSHYQVVGTS
jgi:hypothetical protein